MSDLDFFCHVLKKSLASNRKDFAPMVVVSHIFIEYATSIFIGTNMK